MTSIGTAPFPRMHVSLYVSDLQRSMTFYDTFFGRKPEKVRPGYAKYVLDEPALIISFVENKDRVQPHFGHLGFQVETQAQMEERLAAARELRIVSREEIGTACCYAMQDKFWANDPDGHQWEVYYFHADAEFNDPHYAGDHAAACCTPSNEGHKKVSTTTAEELACCDLGVACC